MPDAPSRSGSYTLSTPTAPSRNNPISLRIYKALGTTFDDPSSREALEIAASFYSHTTSVKSKGKAINQDTINGDVNENGDNEVAVNGLREEDVKVAGDDDTWYETGIPKRRTLKGHHASTARKHLKRDVETRLSASSQKFLNAFGQVDQVSLCLVHHLYLIIVLL